MSSDEIRQKYLKFFEGKGHARVDPAPLVLESDPTTLFTSAGMQPLVPYLKGEPHPKGKRLVDVQPSFRTVDIDEVGDNRHLTFFEMLGNWSLGDYFKSEQLEWCLEFFTKELGFAKEKLWVSVFEGTKEVPKDTESFERWKQLGIPENRIFFYGVDKNWWSRSGPPDKMPAGEIGGPDSEVFYEFDKPHDIKYGDKCHPNCECGRFIEIGNSVFIQYQKNQDGTLTELPQKNVDFGGGLERIAAAALQNPDIFLTDLFKPTVSEVEKQVQVPYGKDSEKDRSFRIFADHIRAATAVMKEGIEPSNKLQGYVLRRLIRRAAFHLSLLGAGELTASFVKISKSLWPEFSDGLSGEVQKFEKALTRGTAMLTRKLDAKQDIDGKFVFDLYQTEGFPLELTLEILNEKGKSFSKEEEKKFEEEFERHKELSRAASSGIFKGGLADSSQAVTKLHTATHLLHASLRKILGEQTSQKGSNITAERLRFDFSHPDKLSQDEINKVEDMVNEQIKKDLPVTFETKSLEDAVKEGALHFFGERYGKEVNVYTVGDPGGEWFSKEVCGGPHVSHTGEIGSVRIIKQEKVGSGVVRIYASAG
jgi:alanyl-tRNA synthetase